MLPPHLFGQGYVGGELPLDGGPRCGSGETPPAAAPANRSMAIDGDIPDLARNAGVTPPKPVSDHDRAADAGADRDEEHGVDPILLPFAQLRDGRAVHVII